MLKHLFLALRNSDSLSNQPPLYACFFQVFHHTITWLKCRSSSSLLGKVKCEFKEGGWFFFVILFFLSSSSMIEVLVKNQSSPKNVNVVINYSPSCCSKPVRLSFIFRTHEDFFGWNLRAFCPSIGSDALMLQKVHKEIVKNKKNVKHIEFRLLFTYSLNISQCTHQLW